MRATGALHFDCMCSFSHNKLINGFQTVHGIQDQLSISLLAAARLPGNCEVALVLMLAKFQIEVAPSVDEKREMIVKI